LDVGVGERCAEERSLGGTEGGKEGGRERWRMEWEDMRQMELEMQGHRI
jgi:hypothetical protein